MLFYGELNGGQPIGLSSRYEFITGDVREMYEKKQQSTDQIRKIFGIKSQPTLYKTLSFAGTDVKGFLKKRVNHPS